METVGDVVMKHSKTDFRSSMEVAQALDVGQNWGAANLYWVALNIINTKDAEISRLRLLLRRCLPQFAITAGEGGLYDDIEAELAKE